MSRLDLFNTFSIPKVQQYLDHYPDIDITKLRDDKKNTLLHIAAFNSQMPLMQIYLGRIKETLEKRYWQESSVYKKPVKTQIQAFINEPNADGFTCLHCAAYKDKINIIEYLESLGGNINCTSPHGTNILHSAAESDALNIFLRLYQKIGINTVDYKNNTPLHLAASYGSQSVVEFLLAQENVKINSLNSEKQTPLHVATSNGKTRIVKRLLINGAERQILDDKEITALDIARNLRFERIQNMLNNNYTFKDQIKFYLNIRTRYQPESRSYLKPILFIVLFLFVSVTSHLLFTLKNPIQFLMYIAGGLNLFLVILFLTLLSKPPVYQKIPYQNLINKDKICSVCQIVQEDRYQHCEICGVCISQFDHHCPWINGCVGKHNIRGFFFFLVLLVILMLENTFMSVVGIAKLSFIIDDYRYFGIGASHFDLMSIIYRVVFGVNLLLLLTFILPVSYLAYLQTNNIFLNKTTYERFANSVRKVEKPSMVQSGMSQSLIEISDSDGCSFGNCMTMLSREKKTQENYYKLDSGDIQTDI